MTIHAFEGMSRSDSFSATYQLRMINLLNELASMFAEVAEELKDHRERVFHQEIGRIEMSRYYFHDEN